MKLISHRGNLVGPMPNLENDPSYIRDAINAGFDVEVDFWFNSNGLYLGHDLPTYQISDDFLKLHKDRLWIHCKNLHALRYLSESNFTYFWHQEDDFTLTSNEKIWTYPYKDVLDKSIIVCKDEESTKKMIQQNVAYGVCSDYVGVYE
jgi:hypothetical protein